jgi:hypothetical protein
LRSHLYRGGVPSDGVVGLDSAGSRRLDHRSSATVAGRLSCSTRECADGGGGDGAGSNPCARSGTRGALRAGADPTPTRNGNAVRTQDTEARSSLDGTPAGITITGVSLSANEKIREDP